MKAVRWPELDIVETNLKIVDEFWVNTNKGPLIRGSIFPLSQLETLKNLKARIDEKKKELAVIEGEIYKVNRTFTVEEMKE